jgi:hypothetical protein
VRTLSSDFVTDFMRSSLSESQAADNNSPAVK